MLSDKGDVFRRPGILQRRLILSVPLPPTICQKSALRTTLTKKKTTTHKSKLTKGEAYEEADTSHPRHLGMPQPSQDGRKLIHIKKMKSDNGVHENHTRPL